MPPTEVFEWDEDKAERNLRAHEVDFEVALQVFFDPDRTEIIDDREDYGEERWSTVGHAGDRLLSVVYTMRQGGRVTRLISARPATRREAHEYYENLGR